MLVRKMNFVNKNYLKMNLIFSTHDRFKQCVMKETKRLCDRGITDGPATKFSTQIIDKAFSFLQDQCTNYM